MVKSRPLIWFMAILAASLACSTSVTSAPVSNGPLDSNSLATIVAGTAGAAAAETAQINLLNNFQSTQTAQANIALGTGLPGTPQLSAEGTSLVKQNDGSYLFTDTQGGYSIVVPSVWLAMRINEQDISKARISLANSDPQIQASLSTLQNDDPKVDRLVAIDTSPADLQTGYVAKLVIFWTKNDPATIEQNIATAKNGLPKSIPSLKVTYTGMGTTSTNLPMGIVETSTKKTTSSKQSYTLYQKLIIFKLNSGSVTLMLSTALQLKEKLGPGFDLIADQIKLLP